MGKNVAVFVDVANIFYAAKAAGVDIDYVTLLKSATAGRDFVRAYAYTGLDPENENQRNFHSFLARHGYKVVSKDIRKYGDGKVKANLDIELVVDMMKTARNLDIAVVISGDGDFAPAIRAVQEMGVRVEVISFRGNTSSDLIEVADLFTDITQIAKVEKGSSRSGRRVADDEEDLSMTEVPEKQTEGTSRGRGRGRGRGREAEREPAAASGSGGRGRARTRTSATEAATPPASGGLVALPGEKLSKAAVAATTDGTGEPVSDEEVDAEEILEATAAAEGAEGEERRRRRRRRGGRGRGRGRGAEAEALEGSAGSDEPDQEDEEADVAYPAPRAPRPGAFGSVWDSQIGMPSQPAAVGSVDEEDLDEPEIPEYLLAEQRRGGNRGGGRGRGGARGGRSAYVSAVERERYGGGRGGMRSGIDRYPDVSGRSGASQPSRRQEPGRGPARGARPPRTGSGSEPWSEVPPELEAQLRAQLSARQPASEPGTAPAEPSGASAERVVAGDVAESKTPSGRRRRSTAKATAPSAETTGADAGDSAPTDEPATAAPKRRTRKSASTTDAASAAAATGAPSQDGASGEAPAKRTTRRRTTRASAADEGTAAAEGSEAPEATTPPRRRTSTRSKATAPAGGAGDAPDAEASPKRRTRRTKASPD